MRRLPNALAITAALGLLTGGAAATGVWMSGAKGSAPADRAAVALGRIRHHAMDPTTSAPATTSPPTTSPPTTSPPPPTTAPTPPVVGSGAHGPITSPPLPPPGPGFLADRVTAVGDSVMIDYEQPLSADIPGIAVTAVVSRWWTTGVQKLAALKAQGELGAVVIVGLGTNGPVSATQFDAMMRVLTGASRVVFVNVHVDQPWQDPNNGVLAAGVARTPRAVLADWYSLAQENPGWLYATQTHMPIDGPGAQALAGLVASAA